MSVGFEPLRERLKSYWHHGLKLHLSVGVEDFRLTGPWVNIDNGWRLIRKVLDISEPKVVQKCITPRELRDGSSAISAESYDVDIGLRLRGPLAPSFGDTLSESHPALRALDNRNSL